MPDLNFQVVGAVADLSAAVPQLTFQLRIKNEPAVERIQSLALRCQVHLDATRRRYTNEEQARLVDLFGEPDRWSRTLSRLLWTHAQVVVGSFMETTTVNLSIPCSFDFNVAATKYFHGLAEGEIPLELLFSGTVFYVADDERLQVAQISWDKEARFRLPVSQWHEMMQHYYPNSAWLRLPRDVFQRLLDYKSAHGLGTFEQAIASLLAKSPERVTS